LLPLDGRRTMNSPRVFGLIAEGEASCCCATRPDCRPVGPPAIEFVLDHFKLTLYRAASSGNFVAPPDSPQVLMSQWTDAPSIPESATPSQGRCQSCNNPAFLPPERPAPQWMPRRLGGKMRPRRKRPSTVFVALKSRKNHRATL
jgi:hypothetical protein